MRRRRPGLVLAHRTSRRVAAVAAVATLLGLVPVLLTGTATPAGAADGDPTTVRVERDLTYARPGGTPVRLDAYLPPAGTGGPGPHPGVILIHGGGWEAGDKSGLESLGRTLAAHGWPSFAVNYRMDTDHRWPDEFLDVQASIRWVQDNAGRFDVDPERIAAFGGSAGGHLAMLAGTDGVGDGHPPLRAVVSWSGPTDLRTITPPDVPPSRRAPRAGTIPGVVDPVGCGTDTLCVGYIDPAVVPDFIGCAIDVCPQTYAAASPVVQVTKATPPMFIANSASELVPVSQLYEMGNALNADGVLSWLLVVPGDGHADAYSPVALGPSIAFLDRYLAGDDSGRITPKSPPTTAAGSEPLPELADGWKLPDSATELPRDLRGTDPLWRRLLPYGLVAAAVALLVGAWVTRARSRRAPPAP